MIDEIDYFPKRDRYKKKKDTVEDWNSLKKLKQSTSAKPGANKPGPAGEKPRRPRPRKEP